MGYRRRQWRREISHIYLSNYGTSFAVQTLFCSEINFKQESGRKFKIISKNVEKQKTRMLNFIQIRANLIVNWPRKHWDLSHEINFFLNNTFGFYGSKSAGQCDYFWAKLEQYWNWVTLQCSSRFLSEIKFWTKYCLQNKFCEIFFFSNKLSIPAC